MYIRNEFIKCSCIRNNNILLYDLKKENKLQL